LHKQVLPFLLRRLKEDVLHDLPPKIIQDYYCDLSDLQKQLYDDFSSSQAATAAEAEVEGPVRTNSSEKDGQPHVFQSLQYLRKLCNHPALILKDNQAATAKAMQKAGISGKPDLSDINHAPKLLALKYVQFSVPSSITHFFVGNYSMIVVLVSLQRPAMERAKTQTSSDCQTSLSLLPPSHSIGPSSSAR
jgi:SNF2 family DNA or RNA helicase